MRVLIACEFSGVVRDAFAARGHYAWSCDLLPTEGGDLFQRAKHIRGDVLEYLTGGWDLMIAHPPCTHLSTSGARWFSSGHKPMILREQALDFVRALMDAPIEKIAIENPMSVISSHIRKSDQVVQPFWFGEPVRKTTCLWLKNLPKLVATKMVEPQMTKSGTGREWSKWFWDTSMIPASRRGHERSKTFQGIASAMAEQWG